MPSLTQYRIVKLQVESFRHLGYQTEFAIQGYNDKYAPRIRIIKGSKEYRFSEPNWTFTSLQLAKLYGVLKHEKRMHF